MSKKLKSKDLPDDMVEIVVGSMTTLQTYLVQYFGSEYITDLNTDIEKHNIIALSAPEFSFFFSGTEKHFLLTFRVGTMAKVAAQITKIISLVYNHDEYTVLDDSYVDRENEVMLFGVAALTAKSDELMTKKGLTKCPICDTPYPQKYIAASGFCLHCEKNKDNIIWC